MAIALDWVLPQELRVKPEQVGFDLDATLAPIVALRSEIPADAATAGVLGTERVGSGIVVAAGGFVLTIGYLIVEAESAWLTDATGRTLPAHVIAYDHASGFGLVQALGRLDAPVARLGSARALGRGDPVVMASAGGRVAALQARLLARRPFAGSWEYLLENAIVSAPAHPHWSGASLFDAEGALVGIASLFAQDGRTKRPNECNISVPIDELLPILDDLMTQGRARRPARPWLGAYCGENDDRVVVGGLFKGGPADRAGLQPGDVVLAVAGDPVADLAELYRRVWALGPAGVAVKLALERGGRRTELLVVSGERDEFLRKPKLHS